MATISSLLADHVTLQIRSVDRLLLAGYVPKLQCAGQVVGVLNARAGGTIPSPAILGRVGRAYLAAVDEFALDNEIAVVRFKRHERKEDVARSYFQRAERAGRFGVVLIGVAQEKASAWRGWRQGGSDAHPHFEFGRQAAFVNHYYFYIRDREWERRLSRPTPTPPIRCGCGSTVTNGPSVRPSSTALSFRRSTTAFAHALTLARWRGSASLSDSVVNDFFARWMRVLPSPVFRGGALALPLRTVGASA